MPQPYRSDRVDARPSILDEFLGSRPEAVSVVESWARAVARHHAWGFESPDDIVQAALLALLLNLRRGLFTGGDPAAYVRRLTKNICITQYRRARARGHHLSIDGLDEDPPDTGTADELEHSLLVHDILDRMDEPCRRIIWMAYYHGLSRREIGDRLTISVEAVRVRLFRCVRKARELMRHALETPAEDAGW